MVCFATCQSESLEMDLLAEYASDSESSSSTSDGNECETVNADKDLNAGAVRQVYLVTYRKKFHLNVRIPEEKQKEIASCPKCFATFILH